MADRLGMERDLIMATAQRQAEWVLSNRSIPEGVSSGPGVPTVAGTGQAATFATGYSGGVTVTPFMLDLSTLDGPDWLT